MQTITLQAAHEKIEATRTQGTIFTATFIKRTTGEERTMQARLNVSRGVTGVGMAYKPSEKNLIACYDVEKARELKKALRDAGEPVDDVAVSKKAYRMISLDAITLLSVGGEKFAVSDDQEMPL